MWRASRRGREEWPRFDPQQHHDLRLQLRTLMTFALPQDMSNATTTSDGVREAHPRSPSSTRWCAARNLLGPVRRALLLMTAHRGRECGRHHTLRPHRQFRRLAFLMRLIRAPSPRPPTASPRAWNQNFEEIRALEDEETWRARNGILQRHYSAEECSEMPASAAWACPSATARRRTDGDEPSTHPRGLR
jgi:hypothetical protein